MRKKIVISLVLALTCLGMSKPFVCNCPPPEAPSLACPPLTYPIWYIDEHGHCTVGCWQT